MTPLAAATATGFPTGTLALLLALWALGYLIACAVWPWAPCPRCKSKKLSSPSGKYWRDCTRCGGRGRRLRLGRRLWRAATSGRDRS